MNIMKGDTWSLAFKASDKATTGLLTQRIGV